MNVTQIDTLYISPETYVKLTEMGNISEIQHNTHKNTKCNIQRLNKETLMVVSTGEVRQVVHYEDRIDDMKSIARSLKKLRDIINCNVTDVKNCIWFTLTYKENMQDPERLYDDFRKFNMRVKYYEKQRNIPYHEYIICAEPQGRGAWHVHGLFIYPCKAPFIPHNDFWGLWSKAGFEYRNIDGNGYDYVNIKSLKDVDNVGAYLTAYLGDMELSEYQQAKPNNHWQGEIIEKEVTENGKKVKKKFLKGARLPFYPAGFRIFRCSRGIKRPQVSEVTYECAIKKVKAATLTFKKSVEIVDDNGYNTKITTFYYNKAIYAKRIKRINLIILFFNLMSRGFEKNERFTDNDDIRVHDEYTRQVREQACNDKGRAVLSRLSGRRLLRTRYSESTD